VAGGGEPGHVQARFGDDGPGQAGADAGDLGQPGHRVQRRVVRAGAGAGPGGPVRINPQAAGIAAASSAARAPSWAILPSREEIWSSSRWGELAVVVVEHAVQGLDEVIALGLHAAAGQGGQLPRVALAGDHRLDHVLRRDGGQLAGHR
jgi:hypothetical protein